MKSSILAQTNIHSIVETNASHATAYRNDIDGLRALAVAVVLIFHAFPEYLPGGFIGVDIFFVISGFLISGIIENSLGKNEFSFSAFYARRIRRIFPSLILVVSICLILGWRGMIAGDFAMLARDVVGGALFSSNLFYWSEAGYFAQTSTAKPLLHLWSLGIEEQFYIFWPLILWFTWRRRVSSVVPIFFIGTLSFLANVVLINTSPVSTFYFPSSRAWELLMGAFLAHFVNQRNAGGRSRNWPELASVTGIGLIVLSISLLDATDSFPGWLALAPTIGAALLLAQPSASINRLLLSHPISVWIGRISYPLYLWHWPILAFARMSSPESLSIPERIGLLALSVFLAAVTERFIERPVRFGGHSFAKVGALIACMFALCSLGAYAWKAHGFPSSYPRDIQELTRYDLDAFRENIRRGKCFLEPDQGTRLYSPECVDSGTAPLWMIWGDSGAASLYQGFRTLAMSRGDIRLAQFTRSSCPPILGYAGYPDCKKGNEWVFEEVKRIHPDVVVLSAIWGNYNRKDLNNTINALKGVGIKRIIILGPTPTWSDTPAHILLTLWQSDPKHRLPGARLDYKHYGRGQNGPQNSKLDFRTATAERDLNATASRLGVEYIDTSHALCTDSGCLTRESNDSRAPFYLDIVHLTQKGANYVVAGITDELVGRDSLPLKRASAKR